jgi:hypothetical protein
MFDGLIDLFLIGAANTSGMWLTPRCGSDSGNYTVIAVNGYGLIAASANVFVVCEYLQLSILLTSLFCSCYLAILVPPHIWWQDGLLTVHYGLPREAANIASRQKLSRDEYGRDNEVRL